MDHLSIILKANGINKNEILKRVNELNDSENIDQINNEIHSIFENLKKRYIYEDLFLCVNEDDFKSKAEEEEEEEFDFDLDNDNISSLKPIYILKMLYILHHEKKLIPPFSNETNILLDYFTNKKKIILFDKSKKNLKEIINLFKILIKTLEKSKIDKNVIDSLINEVSNTIQYLKYYEFIYMPFLGPSNSGKSTLINAIIGKDILPTKIGECTKRAIIIGYSYSDEIIIRKAYFKGIKIFQKTFYYFEPDNIIGKGIDQVKETLNSLNFNSTDKIEDYFYYISTKIKLFDDLGLNDHLKNIIHLIDFPGYETRNICEEKISNVMSICNSFIFVFKSSIIKENERTKIMNKLFTQIKEQKKKTFSEIVKSSLIVFNNEDSINITDKDIEKVTSDIQEIMYGLEKDLINICFFNAQYYSNYCSEFNYIFNLKNLFSKEFQNYSNNNNYIYINPEMCPNKIYKTFYEYFFNLLIEKCKVLGLGKVSMQQKIDEKITIEIDEIFDDLSKSNKFGDGSKYKDKFIKLLSFIRENINNLKILKESNIESFKSFFSLQIYFTYEDIEKNIIGKIDEIISKLDFFLINNLKQNENSLNKMNQIQEDLKKNLENSQKQICTIRDTFIANSKNILKKKEDDIVNHSLSKNYQLIFKEIKVELEHHVKVLFMQIKIFLDNSEKEPFRLYNEIIIEIKKLSDGKESIPELPKFREIISKAFGYKDKNIDDQIYNEINNSLNKIFEVKKGMKEWFCSFFYDNKQIISACEVIIDLSINTINVLLKKIIEQYEKYINDIITLIQTKTKITLIYRKSNEKHLDNLFNEYKDIKCNINETKIKIKDDLYTNTLINP